MTVLSPSDHWPSDESTSFKRVYAKATTKNVYVVLSECPQDLLTRIKMIWNSIISRSGLHYGYTYHFLLKDKHLIFIHVRSLRRIFLITSSPITENEFGHIATHDPQLVSWGPNVTWYGHRLRWIQKSLAATRKEIAPKLLLTAVRNIAGQNRFLRVWDT